MSIDEYVTALHKLARDCNLGNRNQYERMVIQALLLGIESERVRRRLFERQEFTLDEAVATCRAMESARDDLKAVQDTPPDSQIVHAIKAPTRQYSRNKVNTKSKSLMCSRCGEHHPPRQCKAYGKECYKCKKANRFAKYCTSSGERRESTFGQYYTRMELLVRRIHKLYPHITARPQDDSDSSHREQEHSQNY